MSLDNHHTLILAILVLFLGRWVNARIPWLREYGIPEPVTGGLIASTALTLLIVAVGADIKFDLAARDALLIVFFTTVGLSANLGLLAMGGVMLFVLTVVAVTNLLVQNAVGVGMSTLMGYPPAFGLLAGSAALSGGHGTVLAWGTILGAKFGLENAAAMGAAAARAGGLQAAQVRYRTFFRNGSVEHHAATLSQAGLADGIATAGTHCRRVPRTLSRHVAYDSQPGIIGPVWRCRCSSFSRFRSWSAGFWSTTWCSGC